jgi:hypothetical protein
LRLRYAATLSALPALRTPLLRCRALRCAGQEAERAAINALVVALEATTPLAAPTAQLHAVDGDWRLLYTTARARARSPLRLRSSVRARNTACHTRSPLLRSACAHRQVTIRGSKRTKLGLRGMVSIGELTQRIDVAGGRAVNAVGFALAGGALLRGALTIDATFTVASPTRCAQRHLRATTLLFLALRVASFCVDECAQRGYCVCGLAAGAQAAAGHLRGHAAAAAGGLQPAGLVRQRKRTPSKHKRKRKHKAHRFSLALTRALPLPRAALR